MLFLAPAQRQGAASRLRGSPPRGA